MRKTALALALALAQLATPHLSRCAPSPDRPNIVFILADDLGWTDLACQGSRYYVTPSIDRVASEGMRFTDAYTCGPNCQPTRAALMSGQYGPRTGVYTVGSIERFNWRSRPLRPVDNVTSLPADKVTVAQALKRAGYATAIFGKWHLGEAGEFHPSQRGFDEAIVTMGRHLEFKTQPPTEIPRDAYLADWLTDRAVDFVRRHQKGAPFFLYLPHFAVHSPYQAKDEIIARFKGKAEAGGHHDPTYAAMIASLDESVGRVLDTLKELDLDSRTLVVFSSDNGGVGGYLAEGITKNRDVTDNAPLRGGKGMLYEGGTRVPFLARWPGTIRPGATCATPIVSVDLFPTLLELAGAPPPESHTLDGCSILPLLRSQPAPDLDGRAIFWHFPGYLGAGADTWRTLPAGAIRRGPYKLLEFFEDHRVELYNLADDIGQRADLAKSEPDRARVLLDELRAWRAAIGAPMPAPNTEIAPATKDAKGKRAGKGAKGGKGKRAKNAAAQAEGSGS